MASSRVVPFLFTALRSFCSSSDWCVSHLSHRSLLKLSGRDVVPFLQGLVSNDVTRLASSAGARPARALYAYFLNPYGRILYDLILYPGDDALTGKQQCVLLECDRGVVTELNRTLKRYVLRKNVKIESDDRGVFALLSRHDSKPSSFTGSHLEAFVDPRSVSLGWRFFGDVAKTQHMTGVAPVSLNEYHRRRYTMGIPEGTGDLPPGKCFPFESNGDYLNAISLEKGCYVGQELTTRTYHTGVTRKRLFPVAFDAMDEMFAVQFSADSSIVMNLQNECIGKMRNLCKNVGLALLNVDKALQVKEVYVKLQEKIFLAASTAIPPWFKADRAEGQTKPKS